MNTPSQQLLLKFKSVFPEAVTETQKTDGKGKPYTVYALKEEFISQLREDDLDIVGDQNRYELQFPGKNAAKAQAFVPSYKTLVTAKEQSKDFDNTSNVFIEGDNLDVLRMLQNSYRNKIKVIYIDPPYNTGNDGFIYNDTFSIKQKEYLQAIGILDEDGKRQISELQDGLRGRFHAGWLTFMYPRLKLARELLTDDGVIFISIDDNEQANLKLLCDEIFGEENFVACLPTIMNLKGNNDEFGFAGTHEYTFVCMKDKAKGSINQFDVDEEIVYQEWQEDEKGPFKKGANLKSTGTNAPREKRLNLFFPIYVNKKGTISLEEKDGYSKLLPITNGQEMTWRWSKEKILANQGDIIVKKIGNEITLYKKQRPQLGDLPSRKPKSTFYKPEYSSSNGTAQIKHLFGKKVFNNPKPLDLIKNLIFLGTDRKALILDIFAGSCTTAHAVMQLNAEDGGNRKFIMVQWAEEINIRKSKEAHDFCTEVLLKKIPTIAEIAKERIRRAGDKIIADNPDKQLDTGFRVLSVCDSPISKNDQQPLVKTTQAGLLDYQTKLTPDIFMPLLYEALLKTGVTLDLPLAIHKADGYQFAICDKYCYCVTENLTQDIVRKIAEIHGNEFDVLYYLSDCPTPQTSYTELESVIKLMPGDKKIQSLNFY